MPGVPSVGTADYNNNLYQQEPQMPVETEQMPVDLSQQIPVDYSSEVEGPKRSGSLAGPILCGLVLLGLAGFGGYKYGGKNLAKKLDALNNSEAVKNYNSLKEQHDKLKEQHDNLKNAINEIFETAENRKFHLLKPWTWSKKFVNTIKEKLSPYKTTVEKAADEAKEAAEKAKEAADDTAKNAA